MWFFGDYGMPAETIGRVTKSFRVQGVVAGRSSWSFLTDEVPAHQLKYHSDISVVHKETSQAADLLRLSLPRHLSQTT